MATIGGNTQVGFLVGFGSGDENRYLKRDAPVWLSHSCASRQVFDPDPPNRLDGVIVSLP